MNKIKKLHEKKLELFKLFSEKNNYELKVSKSGSYYINTDPDNISTRVIESYSPWTVGVKNIDKLYSKRVELKIKNGTIILLTKRGKLLIKNGNTWQTIARRRKGIRLINTYKNKIITELLEIAFLGKKYLYLKDEYSLLGFNIAYDFSNKEELFSFLKLQDEDNINLLCSIPSLALKIRELSPESITNIHRFLSFRKNIHTITKVFDGDLKKYNTPGNYQDVLEELGRFMCKEGILEIPEDPKAFIRLICLVLNRNSYFELIHKGVEYEF